VDSPAGEDSLKFKFTANFDAVSEFVEGENEWNRSRNLKIRASKLEDLVHRGLASISGGFTADISDAF
jgi:hypothetical protein